MKHIKKSMFISTVLMVVMLIAALSTATFAWYTSNNSVTSSATQVGAAKSQSANIGIGWYRSATASQITFDALVNGDGQGGMYPMVPKTYYDQVAVSGTTRTIDESARPIRDYYTATSKSDIATTNASAIIVDAFDSIKTGADYLRIINLPAAEQSTDYVASYNLVKNKADYVHNATAETPMASNLKATGAGAKLTGNYDIVYKSIKYAYNNEIFSDAPTTSTLVSVTSSGVYTKITPATADDACYGVYDVYTVSQTSEVNTVPATTATDKNISMMLAYSLVGTACNPGSYVVAYIEYNVIAFNSIAQPTFTGNTTPTEAQYKEALTTAIQKIDTSAYQFVCYAADQADTANVGDIYKAEATAAPYSIDSDINWNSTNGFAYMYKIYSANAPSSTLAQNLGDDTSGDYVTSFLFGEANIDAGGYFKSTSASNLTPTTFWNDNNGEDVYTAVKKPALITTRDTTAETNTVNHFYVVNNGSDSEAIVSNLKVTLNVSGDNAALLRIAVFKNGRYYGTLGITADTHFGSVIEGANAKDMPTYNATTSIDLGTLATGANAAFEMKLVAWFDGYGLDDVAAGKNCSFTLSFEAE